MIDENVKKRLMFIKGEDFYFLSYNLFLLLTSYECYDQNNRFKDYRKLAFLIDFISDYKLSRLLELNSIEYKHSDKDLLNRSYANGLIRLNEILKLLFALEKHEIIAFYQDPESNQLDIFLNKEKLDHDFLDWELFKTEEQNIKILKNHIPRIRTLKLETLLSKLYFNYGIKQWDIF